jgi:putative FmdB family regulatory protein
LPTYEYHCDSCDENFDVVQSFHDEPLTTCPTCGSPVRKVFGNVGIVFKGSGFYKTDNRSKNGRATIPPGEHSSTSSEGASKESASKESDTSSSAPSSSTETKKETKKESSAPAAAAPASSSGPSKGSGSSAP